MTSLSKLSEDVLQDMGEAYQRCQPFLSTEKTGTTGENVKDELRRQLLLVAGFKDEGIGKIDLSKITDEEFQKMVREKLLGAMANNGNRQKVVPSSEVRDLIHQGWEYVAQLPTGEAVTV